MRDDCNICGADLTAVPGWRCPDCGGNRRESFTDPLDWPVPGDELSPNGDTAPVSPNPICKCSHVMGQHYDGSGQCWLAACGCRYFRLQECAA